MSHALSLMRYGLVDLRGVGLHDIWGSGETAMLALRSGAVLAVFAGSMLFIAIQVFGRSAVSGSK